jgi:hypothetical protein
MGLEAECTARLGRKTSTGTALLEGEKLIFRGTFRLEVAFDAMRDVKVDGDELVVHTAEQEARLELGAPVAERWARLIKEPKSLFEKLDVGAQSRVAVVDVNDSLFLTALRERTASVAEGRVPEGARVIFFGAETREALRKVALLRARMPDDGVLWIVRPKGSKAIAENDVYDAVRAVGLVDTKVVAFSKTHTAHKCVIPLEMRGRETRPRPPIISIPPSAPFLQKGGSGKPGKAAKQANAKARPAKARPAKAKPAKRAAARPKKKSTAKGKKKRR